MSNIPETPHERLKEILYKKGISQSDLARMCGFSQQTVNKAVNGKKPMSKIFGAKVAKALDINVDYIFMKTNNPYEVEGYRVSEEMYDINKQNYIIRETEEYLIKVKKVEIITKIKIKEDMYISRNGGCFRAEDGCFGLEYGEYEMAELIYKAYDNGATVHDFEYTVVLKLRDVEKVFTYEEFRHFIIRLTVSADCILQSALNNYLSIPMNTCYDNIERAIHRMPPAKWNV